MDNIIKLLCNKTLIISDEMNAWEIFKLKFEVGLIELGMALGIMIAGFAILRIILFILEKFTD